MMMAIGMTGSISRTDEEFEGGEGWRGRGGSATNSRNSRLAGMSKFDDEFEHGENVERVPTTTPILGEPEDVEGPTRNPRNARMVRTLGVGDEFEKQEDGKDRKKARGHYRTRI